MKRLSAIFLSGLVCACFLPVPLPAREKTDGYVSASIESSHHFYVRDAANGFIPAEDIVQLQNGGAYAANNYLKVDYYRGCLSVGGQVEGYFPSMAGYPVAESMLSLSNLYAGWTDESWSVLAGTFYEQLGSGLLFRSWEDRPLGLNNAVLGARATYKYRDILSVRVFGGVPRMGKISDNAFKTGDGKIPVFAFGFTDVAVAAADIALSVSECAGWEKLSWSVEGSALYRHEDISDYLAASGFRAHNIGWSVRTGIDAGGFYFRGEHVSAGVQDYLATFPRKANAQLVELGYNEGGLGISLSARRIYSMNSKIYTSNSLGFVELDTDYNPSVNVLSYCPALCAQHTYMLANLTPYMPRTDGEAGGQLDVFYNFRRGTVMGGKRGMRVHANISAYFSLNDDGGFKGGQRRMWDVTFDVEKQWTKKFKTTLLYSVQEHNRYEAGLVSVAGAVVENELLVGCSHAVVADMLYKWTSKFSTRLELQYLAAEGYMKDWMAALLEVSFTPHWSVFGSDMYNHGESGMHYYNAGVSYAMRHLRVAAGYGRYRGGYICSGGVCRPVPSYTGANLTITASF